MKYPFTKKESVKEILHGVTIVDDYRWLEDSDSSEVLAWTKKQNEFTHEQITNHANIADYKNELKAFYNVDDFSVPHHWAGYYYWSELKAGQNQFVLYRKKGLNGEPELLVDPNGIRKDDAITLQAWAVSPKGKFLAYTLSESGSEYSKIYIVDLKTRKKLEKDTIPLTWHPDIIWLADEASFFYTAIPDPSTVPKNEEHYHQRLKLHVIGQNTKDDDIIFGEGRHKEDTYAVDISDDRKWLTISAARNWTNNEVYIYEIETQILTPLIEGIDAEFYASITKGQIYVWSDYEAEFGRVYSLPINNPPNLDNWPVIIAERDYALSGFNLTSEYIVAHYIKNACSYTEVLDYNGKKIKELKYPEYSTLNSFVANYDEAEYFYSYTNFLSCNVIYHYNPDDKSTKCYREVPSLINAEDFVVQQKWCESYDGTQIPMFLVYKKGLKQNGQNPTLLTGYGGFNSSEMPYFNAGIMPFIERGGIYVVANIRGGGEFGRKWHEAAMLHKKQNSFDDFIVVAEFLNKQNYTSPDKLAIIGGSNGGLLVAACAVQKPKLFKAVVCQVPLLDMIRFPLFLMASRWTGEYGDPKKKADFDLILKWSPYHNVLQGTEYPAFLITTADHDSRVEPLHARKMAALLQSVNRTNPILIRTEVESGHGGGVPVEKYINAQVDLLAFLDWQLLIGSSKAKRPNRISKSSKKTTS